MEIKGSVKAVMEVKSGVKKDGGQWSSQTVVLHVEDGKYPKDIAIDVSGDNCGKLDIGAEVTVQCDVSSREYNGKWYTTVRAWKVDITKDESLPF